MKTKKAENVDCDEKVKKRKKVKNVSVKNNVTIQLKSDTNKMRAEKYLMKWHEDRNHWKFEKTLQIWLIKHMFKSSQVSEETFQIFLEYMSASKGQVFQRIKDVCQNIVQSANQWTEQKEAGLSEEEITLKYPDLQQIHDEKYLRARRLLQSLDDTAIKT